MCTPPSVKSLCWGSQSEPMVLSTTSPSPSSSPLWLYSLTSASPYAQTHTRTHTSAVSRSPKDAALKTLYLLMDNENTGYVLFASLYVCGVEWVCVCVRACWRECVYVCTIAFKAVSPWLMRNVSLMHLHCFFPHIPYFLFSALLSHHLQAHAGRERGQQQKKQRHCYWQHRQSSFPGPLTGVISHCGNNQPEAERSAVSLFCAETQLWDGLLLRSPAPGHSPLPRSGLWQQHWGQQRLCTGLWKPEPRFERRSGRCWEKLVQASRIPPNPGETGTSYRRHREVLVPLCVPVRRHIFSHRHGRHRSNIYIQHVAPDQSGIGGPSVRRRGDADCGSRVLEGPQTEEEEEEGRWILFHWAGNLVTVLDWLRKAQTRTRRYHPCFSLYALSQSWQVDGKKNTWVTRCFRFYL